MFSCMALLSGRVTLWASDDQLIAGAKKEGEVSLYLSTNLTDANGMMQTFKQKYPFITSDFSALIMKNSLAESLPRRAPVNSPQT